MSLRVRANEGTGVDMPKKIVRSKKKQSAENQVKAVQKLGGPFVALAERTRMPVVFSDPHQPNNPIIYANDSFLALTGYDRDEVLGQSYHFLIGPETDPEARAKIESAFHSGLLSVYPEVRYYRKDGSEFWAIMFIGPVLDANGAVVQHFASFLDVTRRKEDERRLRHLVDELNHRVKNTLAIVQSIAAQTLHGSAVDKSVRNTFETRLLALSKVHTLVARENWEGVGLGEIANQILEPFKNWAGQAPRFTIEGDEIRLQPKAALALSIILHELATNATKYGALSNAAGHVELIWSIESTPQGDRIRLRWQERNGPPVKPPSYYGFGTRILRQGVAQELDGEVVLEYKPDGVVCQIMMPVRMMAGLRKP